MLIMLILFDGRNAPIPMTPMELDLVVSVIFIGYVNV